MFCFFCVLSSSGDPSSSFTLWTDGSTKPTNPGPAASAYILTSSDDDRRVILGASEYFNDPRTNNEAEYYAIILGLTHLVEFGVRKVTIKTDSELVARQIDGTYRCKKDTLKPLLKRVRTLKAEYERRHGSLKLEHTRAHSGTFGNDQVDAFANRAVDAQASLYNVLGEISQEPSNTRNKRRRLSAGVYENARI